MKAVTSSPLHVASFLIRLRWEDSPEEKLHGEIEHIQSGEKWAIHAISDIQALIQDTISHISKSTPSREA